MKPRILFIYPPSAKQHKKLFKKLSMPPYGLLQMASYLKANGYEDIHIVDFVAENYTKKSFIKKLKEINPSIVGITAYTENYSHALLLSKIVKEVLPEIKVVLGGPHATFLPKEALVNHSVDYVVMHEGEITLLELLDRIFLSNNTNLADIKGLAFKKDGKIYINPKGKFITDLDKLPFIDRDLVNLEKYAIPFVVVSSRGCPGNCIFCSSRAMSGSQYRMRTAESIFSEIEHLCSRYKAKKIYIADDTFTADKERIYKFCRLIKKSDLNISWICESRIDIMDEDLLRKMHEAGCIHLQFGVESGVQKIVDSIGKKISLERLERILELSQKIKMQIACSFIIGLPQDTIETMRKTIKYMLYLTEEYGVKTVLGFNTPFPGTPECKGAKKLGLSIHTYNWSDYDLSTPIVSTKNFTLEDLVDIYCEWTDEYVKVYKKSEKSAEVFDDLAIK